MRINLEEFGFGANTPVGLRGGTIHAPDRVAVNHIIFKNVPLRHVSTLHNFQLANPWESQLFNSSLKIPPGYKSLLNV